MGDLQGARVSDLDRVDDVTILDAPGVRVQVSLPPPSFMAASLDVAPVAELVGLLVRQRLTGRLDVTTPEGQRALYFEGGAFTGGTSTFTADRFGEVLWRAGRLGLDQLMVASEYAKAEPGKLFGRALVELGFLDASELRGRLVDQAMAIFEAACLEEKGSLAFVRDSYHRQPLRFGISTADLVKRALDEAEAHRAVLGRLGRLDRPLTAAPGGTPVARRPGAQAAGFDVAPHTVALDEAEHAIIQLAMSARQEPKTGAELIAASSLGQRDGARVLLGLIEKGRMVAKAPPPDQETRLRRLCQAVTLAMEALDEAGFGVAEQVRELVDNPPAHLEEALSGLTLKEPLDPVGVLEQARFLPGGIFEMNEALQAVLDEAIHQATDMLPAELTTMITRRVGAIVAD